MPTQLAVTACSGVAAGGRERLATHCPPRAYSAGMKGMQYVVSAAALLGVISALTVGLFSLSRIVMAAARDW